MWCGGVRPFETTGDEWMIVNGKAGVGKSHVVALAWLLFDFFDVKIALLAFTSKMFKPGAVSGTVKAKGCANRK